MCKPTHRLQTSSSEEESVDPLQETNKVVSPRSRYLLLTKGSFETVSDSDGETSSTCYLDENHSEYWQHAAPSQASAFITICFIIACLFGLEYALGVFLKDKHELLMDDVNHKILARHLGVDFTCCFTVAFLGIKNLHVCDVMWQRILPQSWKQQTETKVTTNKKTDESMTVFMCPSQSHARLLTYHPGAQQILLVFLSYQIKNLYDSLVWGDGPEFVFHHIAAGLAAYSGMYPGHSHFYAVFYMGISEISTTFLTLLVNFDDKKGVPGLGMHFPEVKVALAACFVVAFIVCRTILWPLATYHYMLDTSAALKRSDESGRTVQLRGYLKVSQWCCVGLSFLQTVFLYQIFAMGKVELEKMGYL